MVYMIIENGVGRLPHVTEVDSMEDVIMRVEVGGDFIVVEGRSIQFREEVTLIVENTEIPKKVDNWWNTGERDDRNWYETKCLPTVAEDVRREADLPSSEVTGSGSDAHGVGDDDDAGDEPEG